jgi:alcohol dehydrogenase (cytochrome c)
MVPSYDPELNLIFIGTSVTSPATKFALAGNDKQYLYHNSTLAIDPDTGRIVWFYQHLLDNWDLDHTFERMVVTTAVTPDPSAVKWINPALRPGEQRKVVTGIPGKTGIVYTLDARTGQFLWATPTIDQVVVSHIDGVTGKVTINPAALFNKKGDERRICPAWTGGKNWTSGAYSPTTNTMYYALNNSCDVLTSVLDKPDLSPGMESQYGYRTKMVVPPANVKVGTVWAISAQTGKTVWKYEQRAGTMSLVATAGGLVFGGDVNGRFRALDQRTGKALWEANLGSPVSGFPVTFAVSGRQYVVVSTGYSALAWGLNLMTPELLPGTGSAIFVFALPN